MLVLTQLDISRGGKKEETYISVVGTGFGDLSKNIVVVVNSTRVDIIAVRRSKTFKVFFFFHIHHIEEWGMGKYTADRKTGSRSIRDVAPLITLSSDHRLIDGAPRETDKR